MGFVVVLAACGGPAAKPDPGPTISATPLTRVAAPGPDPDDAVEVIGDKGHLDPAAVESVIAARRAALTSCYTQKLGRRTWLGGHVVLRWQVAIDGTVTSVRIADSDLGAWPIERCLLDIAREATFGAPIGGPAELTLPLELSAAAAPPTADDPKVDKAIQALLAKLDSCAKGKLAKPDDVVVTMYLARGRAASVGFASQTTTLDDDWSACAEKLVLGWHVPDVRRAVTKLTVTYRQP